MIKIRHRHLAALLALSLVVPAQISIVSAAAAVPQPLPHSCQKLDARATTYQRTQVALALHNNPSGTCVGVGQISWNKGNVIMTIPKTPKAAAIPKSCPTGGDLDTGWACVYNLTHFHGTKLQFHDCCFEQNLRHYGGPDWVSLSYASTRRSEPLTVHPFRSWLYQLHGKHHGLSYCMEGNSAAGVISGRVTHDQWIFLSNDEHHC